MFHDLCHNSPAKWRGCQNGFSILGHYDAGFTLRTRTYTTR